MAKHIIAASAFASTYEDYEETRKIIEYASVNLAYLALKFREKGGTLQQFTEVLSKHGQCARLRKNHIDQIINYRNPALKVKRQRFDILIWCAAAAYAKVSLISFMSQNIESIDRMRGIER